MAGYYDDKKITYQQIVMRQIEKIQDITSKELRDGNKVVKNLIGEQSIEGEDSRHSYLQAIEMLGSLLYPYFSNGIGDKFEAYCELQTMELVQALTDKDFVNEIETFFSKKDIVRAIQTNESLRNQANIYLLNFKIRDGRRIFRDLVKLFKDNHFLANQSYGEGPTGTEAEDPLDAVDEDSDPEEVIEEE